MAIKKKSTAVAEPPTQLQLFDRAIQLFRAQNLPQARELFVQAITGEQHAIAQAARVHINICDRRLAKPAPNLSTLEDHYNYAVERINARDIATARHHLDLAQSIDGNADHVLYAQAVCASLSGDSRNAYENLKRAIEIAPRNRLAARQDADFAAVAQQPSMQQLLFPEKTPF